MVLAPSSRGDALPVVIPAGVDFVPVSLAPGGARGDGPFECRLKSDSGKTLWTLPVTKLDADGGVTILMPSAGVSTGRYEAILVATTAGHSSELDRYRFSVRRE